jgi:hypothetical protein
LKIISPYAICIGCLLIVMNCGCVQGPLSCTFPIENHQPFSSLEALKVHLGCNRNKPYVKQIADFHLCIILRRVPCGINGSDSNYTMKYAISSTNQVQTRVSFKDFAMYPK